MDLKSDIKRWNCGQSPPGTPGPNKVDSISGRRSCKMARFGAISAPLATQLANQRLQNLQWLCNRYNKSYKGPFTEMQVVRSIHLIVSKKTSLCLTHFFLFSILQSIKVRGTLSPRKPVPERTLAMFLGT